MYVLYNLHIYILHLYRSIYTYIYSRNVNILSFESSMNYSVLFKKKGQKNCKKQEELAKKEILGRR